MTKLDKIELASEQECTGCMSCLNSCARQAISILKDDKGFAYPKIDSGKCVGCHLCVDACPVMKKNSGKILDRHYIFACRNKNNETVQKSSSGGIFYLLASYILKSNGVVYGARYSQNFTVLHGRVSCLDDLPYLMGSKYVQSEIGFTYRQVKKDLDSGINCLFSGTPCQIDGLRCFLKKQYDNLICVDILCHAAPSPEFFKKYVGEIIESNSDKGELKDIKFRYKEPSWDTFSMYFEFEHGFYKKDKFHDPYLRAFLNNYISRESCIHCKYNSGIRVGDITLGDFWGYWSDRKEYRNTNKGISLVIVNTAKGKKIFDEIKDDMIVEERSFSEAATGNKILHTHYSFNPSTDFFWNDYASMPIEELVKKYQGAEDRFSFRHKLVTWVRNHSYLFPHSVRKLLHSKFIKNFELE